MGRRFVVGISMSTLNDERVMDSAPVTHLAQNCGDSNQLLASCGLDKVIYFYDLRVGNEEKNEK
jgi:hypothetical protein